ncbi:MAG: hypothetical protein CMJ78_19230 [Planctomycetaceae bacterium]|nr:hypothetical protein [Planctomycetaceae bacterium]
MCSDSNDHVGLEMRVETPENVVLTYTLAGPAIRVMAYGMDFLVRTAVMVGIAIVLQIMSIALPGLSTGLLLAIWFVNTWAYFVICECFFNGRSIGKSIFRLRVIHHQGAPISFLASMLRNTLRAVDGIVLYGIGLLSMLCTPRLQRLGDLVAGTVVVQERHVRLPREPVIVNKIDPLPRDEIGSYVPSDGLLSVIDQFLGRRHLLTIGRGHALAWILSRSLADRLNYQGDRTQVERYPMAFLARVFVTFSNREDRSSNRDRDERPVRPARQSPRAQAEPGTRRKRSNQTTQQPSVSIEVPLDFEQ